MEALHHEALGERHLAPRLNLAVALIISFAPPIDLSVLHVRLSLRHLLGVEGGGLAAAVALELGVHDGHEAAPSNAE